MTLPPKYGKKNIELTLVLKFANGIRIRNQGKTFSFANFNFLVLEEQFRFVFLTSVIGNVFVV